MRDYYYLILILIIALTYHTFFGLTNAWLSVDAYFHYSFIRESLVDGDLVYGLTNGGLNEPFMFYYPTIFLAGLIGLPLAFMLTPLLFGLISIVLAYYLFKKYFGSRVALISVLLLALSVGFAYRSSPFSFRSDCFLLPFTLGVLLLVSGKSVKGYLAAITIALISSLFSYGYLLNLALIFGCLSIDLLKLNKFYASMGGLGLILLIIFYLNNYYGSLIINELIRPSDSLVNVMTNGIMPLGLLGLLLIKDSKQLFVNTTLMIGCLVISRLLFLASPFYCLCGALIIDYLSRIINNKCFQITIVILFVGLIIINSVNGLIIVEPALTNCEVDFLTNLVINGTILAPWHLGGPIQYYTMQRTVIDSVNGQDYGIINAYEQLINTGNTTLVFDYLIVYNQRTTKINLTLIKRNNCLSLFKGTR